MKASQLQRRASLVAAIAAAVYCAGVSAAGNPAADEAYAGAGTIRTGYTVVGDARTGEVNVRSRYIIGLKAPPLALADAIPRKANQRLAVDSVPAWNYLASLSASQETAIARASQRLGRSLDVSMRFQHAFNGYVTELTDDEARLLRDDPDVALVEADVEFPMDTDRGPTFINAPAVWDGSGTQGNLATKGAGVVVGIIDGGINIGSPSYAPVGADGYAHVNPLGAGNYLGWCNPSNPNHVAARDICSDKVIGGWDFTDSQSNNTVIEGPGFEDEGGHGSHTSSTAVGNARTVNFNGITRNISGVAPHANLVIYDACYQTPSGGSCPGASTTGSINQAVADGVVDVLSYSISGGTAPWTQSQSLAFLGAHNAGIVVVASAGNSGPTPATVGHLEPWVITVAGTMHDRVFGFALSLTGPGAPPANVQNVAVRPGGAPIATATLEGPIIVSPNFANGATDGCAAYPTNFFRRTDGGGNPIPTIAVLNLDGTTSQCGSGVRRTAALNAGAAGVLFIDDAPLSLGAAQTSYSMLTADWTAVATHIATDPANAAARIAVPLQVLAGTPDAVYNSTSRGPNPLSLLKPDVAAPGVEILAAYTRWVAASPAPFGGSASPALNDVVNAISGTSMAAPHVAGSAALLRALNRSWTPAQIKSALSTTAKPNLMEVDGVTPTTPFATGAGRIDVARASRAGLVLDETGANYTAANPATGGNPSQLNIASFQNLACTGTCTFPRKLKSTRTAPVTWTASYEGLPAGAVTLAPSTFTVVNSAEVAVTLNVDSTLLPSGETRFGQLVLTPNNATIPVARMPIAVRASFPKIEVTPAALAASVEIGTSATRNLTVRNVGNPTINWDIDDSGTSPFQVQTQVFDGRNGNGSNFFTGNSVGTYQSEDFTPADNGTLRAIDLEGFLSGTGGTLQATATKITFKLYGDASGVPGGYPGGGAGGELYSCERTPAGVQSGGLIFRSTDGALFGLDLVAAAAAGCPAPPALTAGTRYWVVPFATVPGSSTVTTTRRWSWGRATTTNGNLPQFTSTGTWSPLTPVTGASPSIASLSLSIKTDVACGAPWLAAAPNAGSLGLAGSATPVVTANAASLAVGSYRAFVCVDANGTDPDVPKVAVPFALDVTAPTNVAPEFSAATYAFDVPAEAVDGDAVGTLSANDPNAGDTLTYAITAGNTDDAFAIDGATGAITVAGAPLPTEMVYELTVTVTDAGGLSDTATVTISVEEPEDRIFADGFED